MTVQLSKGRAPAPLWTIIGLCVTILLAVAGLAWGLVKETSDAEHMVMKQDTLVLDHRLTADENIIATVANEMVQLRQDMATSKTQNEMVLTIVKDIQRRLP